MFPTKHGVFSTPTQPPFLSEMNLAKFPMETYQALRKDESSV